VRKFGVGLIGLGVPDSQNVHVVGLLPRVSVKPLSAKFQ
jgi:hypothetical protein